METMNYGAILVSAVAAFILGGIWYHPKVFGHTWGHEAHMKAKKKGHGKAVYGFALVFYLLSANAFGYILGTETTFNRALHLGLIVGVFWVATSFGVNYLFAGRSWKMLAIDAGYHALQFLLYGLIFGLWCNA